MRDDKRKYEAEGSAKKTPRIHPQSPRQPAPESPGQPALDRAALSFPRELVLRLIDWVKQI